MLTTIDGACEYHNRKDCKACKALNFALIAERKGTTTLLDSQFAKAVAFEETGE